MKTSTILRHLSVLSVLFASFASLAMPAQETLPQPFLHYTFQDLATGTLTTNNLRTANTGTGAGLTTSATDFNLRVDAATCNVIAGAEGTGPFANGRALDLTSGTMNAGGPGVYLATAQTAQGNFSQMTVTGWVNFAEPPTGGPFIFRNSHAGGGNQGWSIIASGARQARLIVYSGTVASGNLNSSGTLFANDPGVWQFFAATWTSGTGAGTGVKWYSGDETREPVLDATTLATAGDGAMTMTTAYAMRLGSGGSSGALKAKFADIRIYDTALAAGQIALVYDAAKPPPPPPPPPEPLVHYTFEDAEGSATALNTGALAPVFNLTLSGSAKIGIEGSGVNASGKMLDLTANKKPADSQAAEASGTTATSDAFSGAEELTVCGWYRPTMDLWNAGTGYILRKQNVFNLQLRSSGRLLLQLEGTASEGTARPDFSGGNDSSRLGTEAGKWVFFAAVWHKDTGVTYYKGTETADPAEPPRGANQGNATTATATSTSAILFGRSTGNGSAFPGSFDDIRIYGAALTPAQIKAVYDEASPAEPPPAPVITGFVPAEITVGGTVIITGSNFTDNGTSVVTDVLFGTLATGAANFTVDSDTQITVTSVPAGLTGGGNISVLATTGTAVSDDAYTLGSSGGSSLPVPLVHYTFEESGTIVSSILNSGTLGANFNLTAIGADTRIGDEGSGVNAKGKALDLSGNASMNVSGATAYAAIAGGKTGLDGLTEMTVTGWMKPAVAHVASTMLLRYSDGSSGALNGWNINAGNSDRLGLNVGATDLGTTGTTPKATYNSDANTFNAGIGAWQFFAVTWTAAGGAKWYAGTESAAPIVSGSNNAATPMTAKAQILRLGYAGANNGFKGLMDDIRVYGAALTAAQIKTIYDEARDESSTNELPFPAAWENDTDTRRLETRTAYLKLVERVIDSGATSHIARIASAYANGAALSRFSLGYAYAQTYRASLAPAGITGPAKLIRDGYIENGRKAILAITNAITSADPDIVKSQAAEQAFAQASTVRLYLLLADLGVFNTTEQAGIEQKLATAASSVITPALHGPEYGSFNRSASAAAGLAATATLPTLSADSRRASWLAYAGAVWSDWMHVGDTFEDARGYNGLWIYATFEQAEWMDKARGNTACIDAMRAAAPAAALGRFANLSAPNGVIPDYGNCYWDHGLGFWLYAHERLGGFYERADFLENATRLAAFLDRNPDMNVGDYDGYIEACRAVAATPALSSGSAGVHTGTPAGTTITRPDAVVTTRTTDYGDTTPDKLFLRTGNDPATSAYAALDLHSHGYHGHEDSAAILTYTSGSSVLLHSLGRLDTFANHAQTAWAVPQGRDILATASRHAANEWTRWLVNHRFPGTYTGGPVLDISQITTMFFRVQNDSDSTITITVDVESVTGVKADGSTVQVAGPWTLTRALNAGQAAFASTATFSPALDLSPYEYVLVKWKSTHPDCTQQFGFNGASVEKPENLKAEDLKNPQQSPPPEFSAFSPSELQNFPPRSATATLRTTAGATTIDTYAEADATAPKAGLTRIMLDSAGRQIVHNRDLRMRKADGALLVLDTFEFTETGAYTVGPVWHAQNIVSQTATSVITRDDAQIDVAGSRAAEPKMPLRFDFAASENAGALAIVNSTYAATRNAQKEHFAATTSGNYAAGAVVSILSVLRPGVIDTPGTVPDAPSLIVVGPRYVNYADATGQLSIGSAPPPPPAITGFEPPEITIGGAVTISGFNFTNESTGAPLVTDITFGDTISGDVATGPANFVVNSATTINVTAVPAGIPASGYIKILATSGTAVSAGAYTIAAAPTAPVTPAVPADSAEGGDIILTASAAGNPAPTYTWEYSTDDGATWLAITGLDAAGYTLSAGGATLTLKAVTDAMQGRQFRYTATNGIGAPSTSSAVTLAFTRAPPAITTFDPLALTIGGAVRIHGAHFIKGGASVVTDVQFGGVTAGAGNWLVDSGTQITVTTIPATIPETGNITVLATTGSATSASAYTLAPDPSTILPIVHYDFAGDTNRVTNKGTLGTLMNLNFRSSPAGVAPSIGREGSGPGGNGQTFDISNSTGMGIQGPSALTATNNNELKQDKTDPQNPKPRKSLTFTGWFKPHKDASRPVNGAVLLRNTGAATSGGGFILRFVDGIADQTRIGLNFTLYDGSNTGASFRSDTDKFTFTEGRAKWQFFAVVWHEETGVKFYRGTENNSIPAELAGASTLQRQLGMDPNNSAQFMIGASGSSESFKGYLADFRVYADALTEEHIELIRRDAIAGAGVPDALVRYSFDADSDNAATAVNLGALLGDYDMPLAGSAKVTPAGSGVAGYGRALDLTANTTFNAAASAHAEIPTPKTSLSTQTALTISGWFKTDATPAAGGVILRNAGSPDATTGWSVTTAASNRLTLTIGNGSAQVSHTSADNAYNAGPGKWQFFSVTWDKTAGATWYAGAEKTPPLAAGTPAPTATLSSGSASVHTGTPTPTAALSSGSAGVHTGTTAPTAALSSGSAGVYTGTPAPAAAAPPDTAPPQTLRIGRADATTGAFAGCLDDLRVYDGAFTDEQIQTIYKQATLEPADDDENTLDTPASWAADTDTRRRTARQTYAAILDREIAAQSPVQLAAIDAAHANATALSSTAISHAYAQAWRASIASDDAPGAARQTRANHIATAHRALLAVTNAITGSQAKQQADELVAGLTPLVSLYHLLVDLAVLDTAAQTALEQKLALCATAVLTNRTATPTMPDYGSQHRAASTAAGVAAVAALPTLSTHADRDTLWLKYARAVWSDWKHDTPTGPVIGTIENSRASNGRWLHATLRQADALGAAALAELTDPAVQTALSTHVHAVSPAGAMPDYGATDWPDALGSWLYAYERLGATYARPDLTENATRLSAFINRAPALPIAALDGIVDACRAIGPTPAGAITRPDVVLTTRMTDFGDTLHDKLYFRTGAAVTDKYAAFNLHDHGQDGGNDAGSLILLTGTNGASITLHTLGRPATAALSSGSAGVHTGTTTATTAALSSGSAGVHTGTTAATTAASLRQNAAAVPAGKDILATTGIHTPDESTRWLINVRHPGDYAGGPVLNPAAITSLFIRLENKTPAAITAAVTVESVVGVKPDGTTTTLHAGWTGTQSLAPGATARLTATAPATTLDLTPYEYLLVSWKSTHPDNIASFGLDGAALLPTGVADGRPATATLHATAGSHVLDAYATTDAAAPKGGLTRIMLDTAGRQISHSRDIRHRKTDGALLVLDTYEFTEPGAYTVGPVWHVQNIVGRNTDGALSVTSTVSGVPVLTVVTRDDAQYLTPTAAIAEPVAPLRFDFAATGTATPITFARATTTLSSGSAGVHTGTTTPAAALSSGSAGVHTGTATATATANPQREHFAATVTGDYAAGEKISILSVLRAGTVATTGTAANNVPALPVLMQVGDAQGANYADTTSQLAIGPTPPPAAPAIASFTPAQLTIGAPITIRGYNLDAITHILIGDQPAAFTIVSATQITIPSIPDGIAPADYIRLYAANGNATSNTQYTIARAATITVFPETFAATDGHATMLSVVVDANPAPTYQWQTSTDAGATWEDITGATSATYSINPVTAAMHGVLYRVIVTNTVNGVTKTLTTDPAALVINPAQQRNPVALVLDTAGNIYVADSGDHVIRKIDTTGDATILSGAIGASGNLNGYATGARFSSPAGLTISATTGKLYVADRANHTIREVTATGITNLFAGSAGQAGHLDGAAGNARFNAPYAIASDTAGNLYVADSLNHAIRKITPAGLVSTLAGTPGVSGAADGPAATASFNTPRGIAAYRDGSVYVADTLNHTIREITPAGEVRTLAGRVATTGTDDGAGTLARFNTPRGMTIGADGLLYVADAENSLIREIDIETGIVTTLAGRARVLGQLDGAPGAGTLNKPEGIALGADGLLYIADTGNAVIRVIDETDTLVTLAITGSTTLPPLAPAPDHGGGQGENSGGGAPSPWFLSTLAALLALHRRLKKKPEDLKAEDLKKNQQSSPSEFSAFRPSGLQNFPLALTLTLALSALQPFSPSALSQQPSTGTIQGQVLNTDTGEYLYQARVRITRIEKPEKNQQSPTSELSAFSPSGLQNFHEVLTDSEGAYRFASVPAGAVTLEASYTGMTPRSTTVELAPGALAFANTIQMSLTVPPPKDQDADAIIMLEKYTVSGSREMTGAAIAQNSQRYATNIKNVVSVDELGFTGDGSIAGAIKFLAGVDLENDDYGFGNAITLSGAPSANVPVTIGGFDTVTSSDLVQNTTTSGNQRSVNLAQLSLNSVSRIEINRSPTPDMPGSALAGSVNIIPKSAFERARPLYTLKLFGSANTKSISLGQYSAPLHGTQVPARPNAVFNAIVPLSKHLGFSLTLSHNEIPASGSKIERISTANWDKSANTFIDTPSNPGHYMLYSYELQDILSLQTKDGINLTFDLKLSRIDTLSLSYNQNYNVIQSGQRRAVWQLDTQILDLQNSTTTNVQNIPGTSTSRGQIRNETYNNDTSDTNRQFQLKYRHNGRLWKADIGASHGKAAKQMRDYARDHLFSSALYTIGSTIKIDDIGPWTVGKITGDYHGIPISPLDIGSYLGAGGLAKTYIDENGANVNVLTSLPDFRVKPFYTTDRKTQLFGNISRDILIGATWHVLKAGIDHTEWKRDQRYDTAIGTGGGFIYNGADLPYATFLDSGYDRVLPAGYGKISSWDTTEMGRFFNANRHLFVQANEGNDYVTAMNNSKYIKETITAAYIRIDSEFLDRRLHLTYGVRFERTEDDGAGVRYDPSAILCQPDPEENPNQWTVLPEYVGKPNALFTKQAQYFERAASAKRSYDNWFPSVNANFIILENLIARAAYSQTVGRPDTYIIVPYLQMPDLSADTEINTFTGGNPGLKPWHSQNISLSLELYTGSIGSITLRGFRRWIKDAYYTGAMNEADATALLASYGVDITQYRNPIVRTYQTIDGTVVTSGLELSGNCNLDPLLPHWARGIQLRASIVRNTMTSGNPNASSAMSAQKMYLYPWSIAGRLSLSRKRYSIGISAKWNDTLRQAYQSPDLNTYANATIPGVNITQASIYEPGTYDYLSSIFLMDLDITVNLTKKISLYVNARNINGSDQKYLRIGPNTPEHLKNYRRLEYEAVWSAGMTITF
jgi:TonB-dependent receptor